MNNNASETISKELVSLILKGNAHVSFEKSVANISLENICTNPANLPYNIWQIVEHIRITQNDILNFSSNPTYTPMKWPEDYWPKKESVPDKNNWENSLKQILNDRQTFIKVITEPDADLYTPLAHGEGQNLLREALLIADHTSYHTGQIILIRRLLNDWNI